MELGVKQRLVLLNVLADVRGNLTEIRILRELREDLSFSDEEAVALAFQEQGGRVQWDDENEQPKDVPIGDAARGIIVRQIRQLDREGQMTPDMLEIIDLFPEVEA